MLDICSESNEGFLLVPAVPCPAGQAGLLFPGPSASRCWLLSAENRSLARTVCLLSSLSSGSGIMLIYRVRPVACSSCLQLRESRSNFLTPWLWCGGTPFVESLLAQERDVLWERWHLWTCFVWRQLRANTWQDGFGNRCFPLAHLREIPAGTLLCP